MGLKEIIPVIQSVEDDAAEEINLDTIAVRVQRVVEIGTNALVEMQDALAKINDTLNE